MELTHREKEVMFVERVDDILIEDFKINSYFVLLLA